MFHLSEVIWSNQKQSLNSPKPPHTSITVVQPRAWPEEVLQQLSQLGCAWPWKPQGILGIPMGIAMGITMGLQPSCESSRLDHKISVAGGECVAEKSWINIPLPHGQYKYVPLHNISQSIAVNIPLCFPAHHQQAPRRWCSPWSSSDRPGPVFLSQFVCKKIACCNAYSHFSDWIRVSPILFWVNYHNSLTWIIWGIIRP